MTSWIVESSPHSLIRVPDGQYTLRLTYGDETEDLSFEVTKEETHQKIDLETLIRGNVPIEEVEKDDSFGLGLLIAGIAVGALLIGIGSYLAIKKYRKHKGGIQ